MNISKITLLPFRTGRDEWRWYDCIQLDLLFLAVIKLQVTGMGKAEGLGSVCSVGGSKGLNQAESVPTGGPELEALLIADGGNISTTRKSRSSRIQSYPRLLATEALYSSKVILLIFKISTLRVDQPNKRVPLLTGSTILEGARALCDQGD